MGGRSDAHCEELSGRSNRWQNSSHFGYAIPMSSLLCRKQHDIMLVMSGPGDVFIRALGYHDMREIGDSQ
jgi:hypothetical protein